MKIIVAGGSGFLGGATIKALTRAGHDVHKLVRSREDSGARAVFYDPGTGEIDSAGLSGFDVVINLAGESIAPARWTSKRKLRLRASRIESTRLIAETLASLERTPGVFLSASATGFYGDRGDEELHEDDKEGKGFLAAMCRDWEAATIPAEEAGIRVVRMRLGIVLGKSGGMMRMIIPLFNLGLGGRLGSGKQYWSWISLDDYLGALQHAISHGSLSGAVNFVSPSPVTNAEFTRALARALGRPAFLHVPAFVLKALLGEMATETVLSGQRVNPRKLLESGSEFSHPDLASALAAVLG